MSIEDIYITDALAVTAATFILLSILGVILLLWGGRESRRANVGAAFLTGAIFTLAAGLNQWTVESSGFRDTITMTSDLTGFDPAGRSMKGFSLAGKNLRGARLQEADLRQATLDYADLKEARMHRADLREADLFYSTMLNADLREADLTGANLRGAEVLTFAIDGARFAGAEVNYQTCWRIPAANESDPTVPNARGQRVLDTVLRAGLITAKDGVLGHRCTADEVGVAETKTSNQLLYICATQPNLRPNRRC